MSNPTNPNPAPLDLDQFGPTLANPDAAVLLAECKRQRAQIAELVAALAALLDCPALNEDENDSSFPAIEAARAALARANGAE